MKVKHKWKINFRFMHEIDMYSRRLELYYNGKPKKTTWIGIIFTLLYVVSFLAFFIYKLIRMIKRKDGKYYDTFSYLGEPPYINVSNENFYGGFGLEMPGIYDSFIDEQVYYPRAYFKIGHRSGGNWNWTIKEIELERCQLEKFGSYHREKFMRKPLNELYCFKHINETLYGHYSYDNYSFFYISFFPCTNSTKNNNKCKPAEVIDYYLKNSFLSFQMQDVEMTPQYYDSPALPRNKDIYTKIGNKLFQEIHAFFQIVNVETDVDILGFYDFQSFKSEQYLKYESVSMMSNLIENNLYETGESFCNISFKLSDKVLTQRRTYTKLIEILGNIGGFMQFLYTLLRIISSFSTKILYELSLVNNLFEFNLDKKTILINNKEKKYIKKNHFSFTKKQKIFIPMKPVIKAIAQNTLLNINENKKISKIKNKTNEEIFDKSRKSNDSLIINKMPDKKSGIIGKIGYSAKPAYYSALRKNENNKVKDKSINNISKLFDKSDINIFNFNMNNMNYNENDETVKENRRIVSNIKLNRACIYFCFFYVKKRKNVQNILLNEGMKLIIEKLDLLNLFRTLYRDEKIHDYVKNGETIKMSENCKKNLEQMYNSLYF